MVDEMVTRDEARRMVAFGSCGALSLTADYYCQLGAAILALYNRAEQAEARAAELEQERDRYRPFVERKAQSPCCCDMVLSGGKCDACKAREALKGTQP